MKKTITHKKSEQLNEKQSQTKKQSHIKEVNEYLTQKRIQIGKHSRVYLQPRESQDYATIWSIKDRYYVGVVHYTKNNDKYVFFVGGQYDYDDEFSSECFKLYNEIIVIKNDICTDIIEYEKENFIYSESTTNEIIYYFTIKDSIYLVDMLYNIYVFNVVTHKITKINTESKPIEMSKDENISNQFIRYYPKRNLLYVCVLTRQWELRLSETKWTETKELKEIKNYHYYQLRNECNCFYCNELINFFPPSVNIFGN